jgi:Zn-dependent protease
MVKFTSREIRDIIISMSVIALIFAYLFSGRNLSNPAFIYFIPITFVAVGLGFVLHELAHKFVAMRYGFWAEYRLWVQGLIFAVITAFFGFVFAAPGAVYIHGEYISKEQNGKISLAGPATNIILAALFFMLMLFFPSFPILAVLGKLGFMVNSFLALFNLIPFSILDGAKVFKWNPLIWLATALVSFLMVIYSMFGSFFLNF